MKNNSVPTKEDWGELPLDDRDLQAAYNEFYGKTNFEMRKAFYRYVIEAADSLRWMPPKPFCYYMQGFAEFIMCGKFHEMNAADTASCFLNLVEEQIRDQPQVIAPLMNDLYSVVTHLVKHQLEYDADVDIYGDFAEKAKSIEALWESSCRVNH